MIPTRDELIEKIAETSDAVINACRAYDSKCGSVHEIVDEVLQALLSALPEPVPGYMNKHDMYYRQLMDMRNDNTNI